MLDPDNSQTDTWPWYAVHCQHSKEWQAATTITTLLDLPVYIPHVRRRLRGKIQRAPFFPGYIFVRADLQIVAPSKLNNLPGVLRLLAFDNQPRSIPSTIIEHIRAEVSEIDAHGGLVAHRFQPGDTVRLKAGPFRGLEAAFLGPMKPSERVRVLVEFLGSLRAADVCVDDLERVHSAPLSAQHGRRSRGKGRPINPRPPVGM
jgi:transcriptional antiterminator RfaH